MLLRDWVPYAVYDQKGSSLLLLIDCLCWKSHRCGKNVEEPSRRLLGRYDCTRYIISLLHTSTQPTVHPPLLFKIFNVTAVTFSSTPGYLIRFSWIVAHDPFCCRPTTFLQVCYCLACVIYMSHVLISCVCMIVSGN